MTDSDVAKLQGNFAAETFQAKLLEVSVAEFREEVSSIKQNLHVLKEERDKLDAEIPDLQLQAAALNEEQDKLSSELLHLATGASDQLQELLEAVETKKKLLEQMTQERDMVDYETLKILAEIRYTQGVLGQREEEIFVGDDEDFEEARIRSLIQKLNQIRNSR